MESTKADLKREISIVRNLYRNALTDDLIEDLREEHARLMSMLRELECM